MLWPLPSEVIPAGNGIHAKRKITTGTYNNPSIFARDLSRFSVSYAPTLFGFQLTKKFLIVLFVCRRSLDAFRCCRLLVLFLLIGKFIC